MSARALLHVTVDALPVRALLRTRPALDGSPVVVAAPGSRAVVLCADPVARARGLDAGTPMSRARRLCPDLVVLPPDPLAAERAWAEVLDVLGTTTPLVTPLGQGRALLDVTGAARLLGPPEQVAALVGARVLARTAMVCAVGVAATATVAALACASATPDGVVVVDEHEVAAFVAPLALSALPRVGPATAARLARLGLRTVADAEPVADHVLVAVMGARGARRLRALAAGRDEAAHATHDRPHAAHGAGGPRAAPAHGADTVRGPGGEHVFDRDVVDEGAVLTALLALCVHAAARLRADGRAGTTVVLTVRLADRTVLTRSVVLDEPADLTAPLRDAAASSWRRLGLQRARVRAVGLRVNASVPAERAHHQMRLGEREVGWAQGERAVDAAVARFGPGAVAPASLLVAGPPRAGYTLRSTATTRPRISARSPSMGW